MSGKLIQNLKRKREDDSPSSSSADVRNDEAVSSSDCKRKREIVDPPVDSVREETVDEDVSSSKDVQRTNRQNDFLNEALQRIAELQGELADLEDLDSGDDSDASNDSSNLQEALFAQHCSSRDVEALGFAMCARETMLFLQSQGISEESPVYQALKRRLVGRCHGIPF